MIHSNPLPSGLEGRGVTVSHQQSGLSIASFERFNNALKFVNKISSHPDLRKPVQGTTAKEVYEMNRRGLLSPSALRLFKALADFYHAKEAAGTLD